MAGPITALLDSGFDAFTNLYDVIITPPTKVTDAGAPGAGFEAAAGQNSLAVRAQDFTPVTLDVNTYQVHYKTTALTRPGAKFEGERKFTLTFRVDASYKLLDLFLAWKHIYADPSNETLINYGALGETAEITGENNAANYGVIKVSGFTSQIGQASIDASAIPAGTPPANASVIAATWEYHQCMVTKVTPPAYSREGSNPATFQVEFVFGKMSEPGGAPISASATPEA